MEVHTVIGLLFLGYIGQMGRTSKKGQSSRSAAKRQMESNINDLKGILVNGVPSLGIKPLSPFKIMDHASFHVK